METQLVLPPQGGATITSWLRLLQSKAPSRSNSLLFGLQNKTRLQMSPRWRSPQWSSGLLRWARWCRPHWAQRRMTRHPSAGSTRHKQITVFIYIIIASCRTLLFYYCRRQGHRACDDPRPLTVQSTQPGHSGCRRALADTSMIHVRTLPWTRQHRAGNQLLTLASCI